MKGAWVTLATNDSYSLGALVLAHSLKQVGTIQELAILVTPGVTNSMRARLSQVFNLVQEVNVLDSRDKANLRLLQRPELGITFTKLHCWQLTQFEKCVFLDADTLVLQNCDELFQREELSAAPDVGWPDCFNSGVFVYKPSAETYDKLIQFALDKGSFDGGDQGLLNLYFSDWAHKDISKHLPFIYNVCSTAFYSYLPAFKQFGKNIKIIHFIGNAKPWLQYFDTETRKVRPTRDNGHLEAILQKWWDIFCHMIHPNLTSDMSGLAGAFAKLTLGQQRTAEQEALEDSLRRQNWEQGNIDYLGRDSFDNIWSKICETLAKGPQEPGQVESPQNEQLQQQTSQSVESTVAASLGTEALKEEQKTNQEALAPSKFEESIKSPELPVESQTITPEKAKDELTEAIPPKPEVVPSSEPIALLQEGVAPASASSPTSAQVPVSQPQELSTKSAVSAQTSINELSCEKICTQQPISPAPVRSAAHISVRDEKPTESISPNECTTISNQSETSALPTEQKCDKSSTQVLEPTSPETATSPLVPAPETLTSPSQTEAQLVSKEPISETQVPQKETSSEIPVPSQKLTQPLPVSPTLPETVVPTPIPIIPSADSSSLLTQTQISSETVPSGESKDGATEIKTTAETKEIEKPAESVTSAPLGTAPATQVTSVVPSVQPVGPSSQPIAPSSQSASPSAQSATPSVQPAAPSTEPAAPSTEPAAPSTEPAALPTEPAAPSTEPAAPSTEPAAPSTELVVPAAEPAAPSIEPAVPSAQPAVPSAQPTAPSAIPSTKPAAPSTQLADPSTQPVISPEQNPTQLASVPQSTISPSTTTKTPAVAALDQTPEPAKETSSPAPSGDACPIVPPPRKSAGSKKQGKSKK